MMPSYEPEAVLIAKDGRTLTDQAGIAADLESYLSLGLPLEAKARHAFIAGDIVQIVLDWSIDGTGPDGEHVHFGGSAGDVVRRGADRIRAPITGLASDLLAESLRGAVLELTDGSPGR